MRLHLNKRLSLLLTLLVAGYTMQAQAPSGYYNNATGLTGTELRAALHEIIKDHTTISYQQIWNAFWSTDNKGNNVVWDMYSDGASYSYNYYHNSNSQCGQYTQEGDCYNREHSWPKSWFSGDEQTVPGRDLHHIFPTDGYVNYRRSSYPFGEVNQASWTSQNGSKLGTCKSSLGYSGTVFEPIDEYKGDLARALMYMSVRYYGEDDEWGNSGMTVKADLKDWAINMLLDWSDNDPVSQKEIDRNNTVYGIQGNRNPFIDHPEFAHIIWEEGWTGVAYNLTCAAVQHGSISAPSTAVEGTMVNLTATPHQGYMLGNWSVYKTGDPNTTIPVSNNGIFTMPSFNVTVSATFIPNTTYYTLTQSTVSHGSLQISTNSAQSGTTITLSSTPANGYCLYSYYVYKTGDISTIVYSGTDNSFTMPAYDVTVAASFAQGSNGDYEKVTAAPENWDGEYLIVYENGSKAFDGSRTTLDATNNGIQVSISNNAIPATSETDAAKFTIAASGSNYTIQSASGYYIGRSANSNGLDANQTNPLPNTITYNNSSHSVDIIGSGGAYLRFNKTTGQLRFRYFQSTTYSNQQPVQLYKKTAATVTTPTHTIQFHSNGGTPTSHTQTVNEFEPTPLDANIFIREGYAFDSWNTDANGEGITYYDAATVTLLDNLTLYAQWNPLYTITLDNNIGHGSISASATQAVEGSLISLTAVPEANYDLDHWIVVDANNEPVNITGNQFVMPASAVTVSAVFSSFPQDYTQKYYLVTSADQLVAGRTYLIVSNSKNKAMGTQGENDRSAVSVSINNSSIANLNNACELTLGIDGDYWTLYDAAFNNNEGGFLYASSSQNNQLKTNAIVDDNGKWSINIGTDGEASIVANGNNTHRILRYGSGGNYYGCFQSNTQGTAVSLFIRSEEFSYEENTTLACLNSFDLHTVLPGVTLTASSVKGTEMCNNASQLILEEGAQFIHDADGLNATLKKNISAYSSNDGWYTLSAPFSSLTPTETNGLLNNDYDLYAYDEDGDAQGYEWINYKNEAFDMTSGTGYLYANSMTHSLRLSGTLNSGTFSQTIDLDYSNSVDALRGFNLLGNPTTHDISYTQTNDVSDGYYYIEDGDTWVYSPSTTVPVGRGFLVKANTEGQSVTLNPQQRGASTGQDAYISLSIDGDKTYIKLSEGVSMPRIELNGRRSAFYALHHKKAYTMLVRNAADQIDLCYDAHQSGQKTLNVDLQGQALDYLHLVDHMTGADVNLLETSSYSFCVSPSDFALRFELRFAPPSGSHPTIDHFAHYANGNIVLDYDGAATLQVFDLLGRIVEKDQLTPGIYLLRLITADAVYVQKIVVE